MLANTSLTRVLYYPTSLVKHPNNEYEYTVILYSAKPEPDWQVVFSTNQNTSPH